MYSRLLKLKAHLNALISKNTVVDKLSLLLTVKLKTKIETLNKKLRRGVYRKTRRFSVNYPRITLFFYNPDQRPFTVFNIIYMIVSLNLFTVYYITRNDLEFSFGYLLHSWNGIYDASILFFILFPVNTMITLLLKSRFLRIIFASILCCGLFRFLRIIISYNPIILKMHNWGFTVVLKKSGYLWSCSQNLPLIDLYLGWSIVQYLLWILGWILLGFLLYFCYWWYKHN